MRIVGISYGFHDASVALVSDGKLIFHSTEEKFTGIKHESSFPLQGLKEIKKHWLNEERPDKVYVAGDIYENFYRVLKSSLYSAPFEVFEFAEMIRKWFGVHFLVKARIAEVLKIPLHDIEFVPHHLCHAFNAFAQSSFESSKVVVCDGVGDSITASSYQFEFKGNKVHYSELWRLPFPHSLGLFYTAFTEALGFRPNDSECSTMALAAFGSTVYKQDIEKVFSGNLSLNNDYLNFNFSSRRSIGERLKHILRPLSGHISYKSRYFKDDDDAVSEEERIRINFAASVQSIFEDKLEEIFRNSGISTADNICLAGGSFLNCKAVQKLKKSHMLNPFFIAPDPGDGGNSVGAAFWGLNETGSFIKNHPMNIYLGPKVEDELAGMGEKFHLKEYQLSDDDLAEKISEAIRNKKIIGWVQGRNESGPRALGNRSILCRADSEELIVRLNKGVKKRPDFRPYAVSMTEETSAQLLENDAPLIELRFMQMAWNSTDLLRKKYRSSVHIDGTVRPQVVFEKDNVLYFKLLRKIGEWNQEEIVLNTSFNESGSPVVSSSYEAFISFMRMDLDFLVVGNRVFEK